MSEPTKKPNPSQKKELDDAQLESVSGGFNPQPEPPGAYSPDQLMQKVRRLRLR